MSDEKASFATPRRRYHARRSTECLGLFRHHDFAVSTLQHGLAGEAGEVGLDLMAGDGPLCGAKRQDVLFDAQRDDGTLIDHVPVGLRVVIGLKLRLKTTVHDSFAFVSGDEKGQLLPCPFRVVGILPAGDFPFDEAGVVERAIVANCNHLVAEQQGDDRVADLISGDPEAFHHGVIPRYRSSFINRTSRGFDVRSFRGTPSFWGACRGFGPVGCGDIWHGRDSWSSSLDCSVAKVVIVNVFTRKLLQSFASRVDCRC
jgi:hypothetical protein